jgi:hypothetical protein
MIEHLCSVEAFPVSDIDIQALETVFENWRKDRAPTLKPFKAFEKFAVEQVLKDVDPDRAEILYQRI